LSESDDEFIPQGDASESECYQCTNHWIVVSETQKT
jgi:hypothetical protein